MKTLYGRAVALMLAITVFCVLFTAITGVQIPQKTEGLQVTASFYPMYIAALNVVGQIPNVTVSCLVGPKSGCVHDYQMTPNERMLLQQTDVLIANGVGAEAFLEGHLASVSGITVVDTSEGIDLLCTDHDHQHHHGESEENYNQHIWTSPMRYRQQVIKLAEGLAQVDPEHKQSYLANAEAYCQQIDQVWQQMQNAVLHSGFTECVIFSESLAYLAQDLGLQVLAQLEIGEEGGVSAAERNTAEQAVRGKNVLLLYDNQYQTMYTDIGAAAKKSVVVLVDTAVQGNREANDWLRAMRQTALLFEQMKGGDGA